MGAGDWKRCSAVLRPEGEKSASEAMYWCEPEGNRFPSGAALGRGATTENIRRHQRGAKRGAGGAEGNRTLDLLNAIQALSQLSYGPTPANEAV